MSDHEAGGELTETAGSASRLSGATAMVLQGSAPLPPKLKVGGDLSQAWKKWRQVWDSYEIVSQLARQTDQYRVATFITCIGSDALEIYNSLPLESETDKTRMDTVLSLMEAHCVGATNEIYERFQFQRRQQEPGETIEQFVTALRALARTCGFADTLEERVRDQIVYGVCENGLRKQLLQKRGLTLHECVDTCRAFEATNKQLKVMTEEKQVISAMKGQQGKDATHAKKSNTRKQTSRQGETTPKTSCKYCGWQHEKGAAKCPAYGKTCAKCKKKNHYARMCRWAGSRKSKQQIYMAEECSDTDTEDEMMSVTLTPDTDMVNRVNSAPQEPYRRQIYAKMIVGDRPVRF